MNKSIQVSRRNSRISRLFDKEAFDIEAAKVSKFAQQIVNSPRKRSSILNLTPVLRGQTASAINSPLVSTMNGRSAINSPLVSAKKPPQNSVKTPLHKMTTAEIYARQNSQNSVKTPLHKRPSMTSAKLTETKKKRSIVMNKPTPGKEFYRSGAFWTDYLRSFILSLKLIIVHRNGNRNKQSLTKVSKSEILKIISEHTIWQDLNAIL